MMTARAILSGSDDDLKSVEEEGEKESPVVFMLLIVSVYVTFKE